MRTDKPTFPLLVAALASTLFTHASAQSPPGPTFDVVWIKRNTSGDIRRFSASQLPDGGVRLVNATIMTLLVRAYSPLTAREIIGLPDWVSSERYDVTATSSLTQATAQDRAAMLQAMLADRFKMAAHFEKREMPAFDLVLARSDGRLGSGLTRIDADCAARIEARRAAFEAARNAPPPSPPQRPDLNAPPPQCTIRIVGAPPGSGAGDRLEGETTMGSLAESLRLATNQFVIDKTGLRGSYRVLMTFDMTASMRGPSVGDAQDRGPTVFTAIREQLGLKLESSRAERDTLVIDHLEHPTEN